VVVTPPQGVQAQSNRDSAQISVFSRNLPAFRPPAKERNVQCPTCGRFFVNLQGHSCPQKQAGQNPQPDSQNVLNMSKDWPFATLAQMQYSDIFCCPNTIKYVPEDLKFLFSGIVNEIMKHILRGEKLA